MSGVDPAEFPDWRLGLTGRVAETKGDVKEGTPVHFGSPLRVPGHGEVNIPVVSPVRLAFSIAIDATRHALSLRAEVEYVSHGRGKDIPHESYRPLFDFFEHCMIAITFSYQAVEAHANDVIGRRLRGKTMTLQHRGKLKELSGDEIERWLSTEEKVSIAIPRILDVEFKKGGKVWSEFKALGGARDLIVHLKSKAQRHHRNDASMVAQLMTHHPKRYARAAIGVIRSLSEHDTETWLQYVEAQLDRVES